MRRAAGRGGERGFALLAALLIAAIALLATAALVAAALSSASIAADDDAAVRAADAAAAGVADALQRLRWGWLSPAASSLPASFGPLGLSGATYTVTVAPLSAADLVPRIDASSPVDPAAADAAACRIDSVGVWGPARRTVHVVALSTADALPRGLVVGAGATIRAPLELTGCGLYAGGDVDGREWVTLSAPGGSPVVGAAPAPDLAYGGLYPAAGVHAAGQIVAGGVDEHASRRRAGRRHRCRHRHAAAGRPRGGARLRLCWPLSRRTRPTPSPRFRARRSTSDCSIRSSPPPVGSTALAAGGRIYVLDASNGPVTLSGERPAPPQACPLTVVVLGDCMVDGAADAGAVLTGELVVTGTLTVRAPLCVDGGLYAGALAVDAGLTLRFTGAEGAPGGTNVRDVSSRQ